MAFLVLWNGAESKAKDDLYNHESEMEAQRHRCFAFRCLYLCMYTCAPISLAVSLHTSQQEPPELLLYIPHPLTMLVFFGISAPLSDLLPRILQHGLATVVESIGAYVEDEVSPSIVS